MTHLQDSQWDTAEVLSTSNGGLLRLGRTAVVETVERRDCI